MINVIMILLNEITVSQTKCKHFDKTNMLVIVLITKTRLLPLLKKSCVHYFMDSYINQTLFDYSIASGLRHK